MAVVDSVGKSGAYVRKHDPGIGYRGTSGNRTRCANISSFANFDPAAANFEFIPPDCRQYDALIVPDWARVTCSPWRSALS